MTIDQRDALKAELERIARVPSPHLTLYTERIAELERQRDALKAALERIDRSAIEYGAGWAAEVAEQALQKLEEK